MEGHAREKKKRGEGGCKVQGVGIEKDQGRIRFWRLGGLGPVWATLSQFSKHFYFAILIWQIILENGDDGLDKIFSDNFRKIK